MAKGAKRQRLDDALRAARASRVGTAETQWNDAADDLMKVAEHLRKAAKLGLDIKGDAGTAMFTTMDASAERLKLRAQDMQRGKGALRDTGSAIVLARDARDDIDKRLPPLEPDPFSAPEGYDDMPAWRQTEVRQNHESTQSGRVEEREREREDAAQEVADNFEKDYKNPIKVMQDIYGYEPPPPAPTGDAPTPVYSPAGGSGTQSGVFHGPRDGGGGDGGDGDGGDGGGGGGEDDGPRDEEPTPENPPPPVGPEGPEIVVEDPPTSPWVDIPTNYGDAGPGGTGGSGPSVSPAVLGAGAGVVTAGALGAAARGGLSGAGISSLRNLTSRGGPLGGTARGAGPVLGKGGVGSTGSPTGARGSGAAGRGAGGLRSGAGAGAGAGTGAGRGGGRGVGAGAGAGRGAGGRGAGTGGGRGRGKREEEQQQDRDLFDDGQDWIDDEGVAPGVID